MAMLFGKTHNIIRMDRELGFTCIFCVLVRIQPNHWGIGPHLAIIHCGLEMESLHYLCRKKNHFLFSPNLIISLVPSKCLSMGKTLVVYLFLQILLVCIILILKLLRQDDEFA